MKIRNLINGAPVAPGGQKQDVSILDFPEFWLLTRSFGLNLTIFIWKERGLLEAVIDGLWVDFAQFLRPSPRVDGPCFLCLLCFVVSSIALPTIYGYLVRKAVLNWTETLSSNWLTFQEEKAGWAKQFPVKFGKLLWREVAIPLNASCFRNRSSAPRARLRVVSQLNLKKLTFSFQLLHVSRKIWLTFIASYQL